MKQLILVMFLLTATLQVTAQSKWQVRIMPQAAFGGRNTVQRPNNDEGTRISLNSDFQRKNSATFSPRFEVEYSYNRHHAVATAALLTDRFEGVAPYNFMYDHEQFMAGSNIDAVYRFNTYRLSYRYRLVENSNINFELGATILFRDAFISFEDETKESKFSNFGVAPLISYYFEWKALERLSLLTYGDAFAIKVGRAEDIFVGAKYQFTPMLSATAGYRLLEGGSDSDKVYTMAAFHFISVGIGVEF